MAQNCQHDATGTISLSREDMSGEATPTSTTVTVDVSVAKSSRSPGASKHGPGLRLTSSGKWGVQIWHPFKRSKIWLGSYSTAEEATNLYNKKKIEYESLRSKLCEEDASSKVDKPKHLLAKSKDASKPNLATRTDVSLRVVESNSSTCNSNCIVLALSAKHRNDTSRKKSENSSVQNRVERLSMIPKCRNEITISSKDDGAGDAPVPKKSRSLGAEKHPGLKITTSGKYGVQILHPITRSRVWLGSYSTIEEAMNIYNTKNLEYASLMPEVIKHQKHSVLKATSKLKGKSKAKAKGKRKRKRLVIQGITVQETESGKWGASIRDPVSKIDIWLGSHLTPEKAVESYHRKRLEFDPSYAVHLPDLLEKDAVNDIWDTTHSTDILKLTSTEKWRVAVRHPMLKHSLTLGSYDTSKEAEEAYNRKKVELDAMINSERIVFPKSDVGSPTTLACEGVNVKKYTGVRPGSNGRWRSQIQGPFSKKNKVYLGTFSTAEEAAEAFNRARHEFDAIVSLVKKADTAESKAEKPVLLELDRMPADERTRVFEIVVGSHSCNNNPNSAITVGCNNNGNHNEIVEVSPAEQEFGMGVIDCYGRLVGEYSRLDDELWLSRPGDDDDFDVNGAFMNGNVEFAWDPDSKPSLFPLH
ncbi:hypothetical protein V2J09_006081 [Rumex salicifolius]